MHILFLSNVLVMNPVQVPQQGPYGENCLFTRPLLHTSQIPHKNFPT